MIVSNSALHPKSDGTVFAYAYQSATLQPISTGWTLKAEEGGVSFAAGTMIKKLTITNKLSFIQGKTAINGSPTDVSVEGDKRLQAYIFEIDGETEFQEMVIYGDVEIIYAPSNCYGLFSPEGANYGYSIFSWYNYDPDDGCIEEINLDCFYGNGENVNSSQMFIHQKVSQLNLSNFVFESYTDSSDMFDDCDSLELIAVPYNKLAAFQALDNGRKSSEMVPCYNGFLLNYHQDSESYSIVGYIGSYVGTSSSPVTIPTNIVGIPVTAVRDNSDGAWCSIEYLDIPASIAISDFFMNDDGHEYALISAIIHGDCIAEYAFNYLDNLVSIEFGVGIGYGNCYNCPELTTVKLGSRRLPNETLCGCPKLSSVTITVSGAPISSDYVGGDCFNSHTLDFAIYVDPEYVDDYKSHHDGEDGGWYQYATYIQANPNVTPTPAENTGVVTDVVIPTVVCACLVVAIMFVARKKKMNA